MVQSRRTPLLSSLALQQAQQQQQQSPPPSPRPLPPPPPLSINYIQYHDSVNALVSHVNQTSQQKQLQTLSKCIGFSTAENSYGVDGDLSFFHERRRLLYVKRLKVSERRARGGGGGLRKTSITSHLLSLYFICFTQLQALNRFEMDTHELGLEDTRSVGFLQPDLTSVIVRDQRSRGYQLLTVGDPTITITCCTEVWQGENSTISALRDSDKKALVESIKNWSLADLSVR